MSAFTKTKYSARVATLYKLGTDDKVVNGVNNDKFTGNWEVMNVPTDQIPTQSSVLPPSLVSLNHQTPPANVVVPHGGQSLKSRKFRQNPFANLRFCVKIH